MKKVICFALCCFLLLIGLPLTACAPTHNDYVRIHIRANSNSELDQSIKLDVRDCVVAYLVPLLKDCKTAAEAKEIIGGRLDSICEVANGQLGDAGYSAKARLCKEDFPKKSYGSLTLQAGSYDALVLELGEGTGENWWCVAYPPLCFVEDDADGVVYKSKIMEIIQKNKDKKNG